MVIAKTINSDAGEVSPAENDGNKVDPKELRKVIVAAMAGSFIEWFEFSVYGYLAVVMGKVFYAGSSSATQLFISLANFAIGFLARPLGGFVCGPLGDKFGRKNILNFTLTLMAVATFSIGLIPPATMIGMWAPVLLILFRLMQGFSAGGEASGASIYVAEHSADSNRTFMTSWIQIGGNAGFLFGAALAASLQTWLTNEQLLSWGWRFPFLLAAPLALLGLYIRYRLNESPIYIQAADNKSLEQKTFMTRLKALRGNIPELMQSSGIIIVTNITLFVVVTYIPVYLHKTVHLTPLASSLLGLVPMCLKIGLIPLFGWAAERVGRKRMMITGSLMLIIFAIPSFRMIDSGNLIMQLIALSILAVCLASFVACVLSIVPSLFPVETRYTGMAISYNFSVALFAGTAPMINAWLVEATGNPLIPAYYLMFGAVVGVIALISSVDRTGKPMNGDKPNEMVKA